MLMCETLPGQLLLRGRAWLARCGNEALRRPSAAACYPSGRTLQNGCMVIGVNIVCKRVWLRRPLWVVIGRRGGRDGSVHSATPGSEAQNLVQKCDSRQPRSHARRQEGPQ